MTPSFFVLAMFFVQVTPPDLQSVECSSSATDSSQPVMATAGQMFTISLAAQPGTGYAWSLAEAPDPAIVEPLVAVIMPPPIPRPGATQNQCFVFSAVADGEATIQFQYARPFESDQPPAKTEEVHVIVSDGS